MKSWTALLRLSGARYSKPLKGLCNPAATSAPSPSEGLSSISSRKGNVVIWRQRFGKPVTVCAGQVWNL